MLKSEIDYKISLNIVPTRLVMFSLMIAIFIYGFAAMHMDFQQYNFKVPDSLQMLSAKFWIFIALSNVLLAAFYFKLRQDFLKACVVTAAYIFIAFPLAQWPAVMGFDQFLHASTAKLIAGGLQADDANNVQDVYFGYPVTSIMELIFKNITGMDYILGAAILSAIMKGIVILLIYLVCKRTFDSSIIASLAVMLFLVANFRFNDYYQFAPQSLAFALYLFLIYCYLRSGNDRKFSLVSIITYIMLVLTHPYASFFALATMGTLFGLKKIFRARLQKVPEVSSTLVLFAVGFWVFWQIYPAVGGFNARSPSALELFTDVSKVQAMYEEVKTIGRSVYQPILLDYQMGVQIFLAAGALLSALLARKHVPRIFLAMLGGLLLLTVQLVYTSDPPRLITLDKVIYFGMLPASCLSIYLISYIFRRSSIFHIIAGSILIALVPVSFFASNQYTYMDSVKSWEIDSVAFATNHVNTDNVRTAMMDSVTSKVYSYYSYDLGKVKPFVKGYFIHRNVENPDELHSITPGLSLMSFREKVDWYYHQGISPQKWDQLENGSFISSPNYDKIYDIGYAHLYVRNN